MRNVVNKSSHEALTDILADAQLPKGWAWSNLQSLVDMARPVCYGILMPKENVSDGVLYVKVRDFKGDRISVEGLQRTSQQIADLYRRSSLQPGDLLVSIRGTFGRVAIVPVELSGGNITQDSARIALLPEIHRDFVASWLRSPTCQLYFKRVARGVAVRGVNIGDLKPCPVPVPPQNEQRRIVAKIDELFSKLDAGVAALERARAALRRYRAAVLKAAVEGKLTEDWRAQHPDPEPASTLLERILAERRSKWEEARLSEFGRAGKKTPKAWQGRYRTPEDVSDTDSTSLPQRWVWATVDQLAEVGTGTTPLKSNEGYYKDGSIPWVTSTAVNSPVVHSATEFVTERALNETTLRIYPPRTLIVALYGEGKTRGKVSELAIESTINQALAALVMTATASSCRAFLKIYLAANYEKLRRQAAGGMQPNLNLGLVRAIALGLPPIDEQVKIVAEVDRRLSVVDETEAQVEANLKRAARLRQGILKRAFEGKLVPQDPADEPAEQLLARIRADSRDTTHRRPGAKRGRLGSGTDR